MARHPSTQQLAEMALPFLTAGSLLAFGGYGIWLHRRSRRAAERRRVRSAAFVLGGLAPMWLRFDGEFAVYGGAGFRARLRYTDLVDLGSVPGKGHAWGRLPLLADFALSSSAENAVTWRLSEILYSRPDYLDEAERFDLELAVWRAAQPSDRESIAPPIGRSPASQATYYTWVGLMLAFLIPVPGMESPTWASSLGTVWTMLIFARWPNRPRLRKAGWTFDDERAKRRARASA